VRTKLAGFFSLLPKNGPPLRGTPPLLSEPVTFSNPLVALADCSAPHSSLRLAFTAVPSGTDIEARPLNHHPATEAGAAPVARWLHKSGSN